MGARLLPMGSAARFAARAKDTDHVPGAVVALAPAVRCALAPSGALPLVTAHTDHPALSGETPAGAVVVQVDPAAPDVDAVIAAIAEHTAAHGVPELVVVPEVAVFTAVPAAGTGTLASRIALVTGGAMGFGFGIAHGLLAAGAHVAIADIAADSGRQAAADLGAEFGAERVFAVTTDVADEQSQMAMAAAVVARWGGIDLFVANAGIVRADGVMSLAVSDFDLVTDVNYRGYFLGVRAVAPVMAAQHRVRPDLLFDIIEINSKSGLEGSKANFAYSGSKFGGIGLTQSFALELIEHGIKVNAVCPGNYFDGPLWSHPERGLFVQYSEAGKIPGAKTPADVRRFYETKVPMGRGAEPADVALAVQYLVAQQYETGQALPVTGGQTMLS